MIGALLYLQSRTIWNRTRVRLKRLKQPKYILGALVGGLYFYFYFIRYLFGFGPQGRTSSLAAGPGNAALYQSIGALFLFILVLVAWLVPRERAALVFTEAEVAFLFPALIAATFSASFLEASTDASSKATFERTTQM